jgi:D-hexose-6-phosphate mutarotase
MLGGLLLHTTLLRLVNIPVFTTTTGISLASAMQPATKKARVEVNSASASIFIEDSTGLRCVVLSNTAGASVSAYCWGAHVTSWKNSDCEELLFMSEKAVLDGKKAIRGGIPICWPQFGAGPAGPHTLPKGHGFARISEWDCVASTDGSNSSAVFTLVSATQKVVTTTPPVLICLCIAIDFGQCLFPFTASQIVQQPGKCTRMLSNWSTQSRCLL